MRRSWDRCIHKVVSKGFIQAMLVMIVLVATMVMGALTRNAIVKAVSCNVVLSMEEKSVLVDSSFNMTISIDAEEVISGVEMMITYDSDLLEFETASPAISGGDGMLKISDLDMASDNTSIKYIVKYKIKKAGVSYVKVTSDAAIYNEDAAQSMSVASNVLSVVGEALQTTSDNADLQSLKISGGSITPEFSKDVLEYTVSVDDGIDKLIIGAQADDSNAKVKVNGNDKLEIGENRISVIVQAENGDTKEYTIYAVRDEVTDQTDGEDNKDTETKDPEEAENETIKLDPIQVENVEGQIVLTTYGIYQVEDLPANYILPKGYTASTLLIDDSSILVYQNPEEISDYVLIYAHKEGTKATLYQYDKKEQTLQRANLLQLLQDVNDEVEPENVEEKNTGNHFIIYLLIGLSVLCILFMVTTVIFYRRYQEAKSFIRKQTIPKKR